MKAHAVLFYGVLILLFLVPAAPGGGADPAPALTARETGVALYARQDPETDRIATLEKGEPLVPIVEAIGAETWYMVRTKLGLVGWVRASDVVSTSETRDAFKEQESRTSSWVARSSDGRTFNGTWSVAPDSTQRSAAGAWTLSGAGGATILRGTWSADKHETGWNGVWSASVDGGKEEYIGSWSAQHPHVRNAPFSELFAAAVKDAIDGLWTGGNASGSFSIRSVQ